LRCETWGRAIALLRILINKIALLCRQVPRKRVRASFSTLE
jgi:hypothetical protein